MEIDRTIVATNGPQHSAPPALDETGGTGEFTRGTVVGRYLLLDRLGAGGIGIVYAAYDPELDRKVALKLVLPAQGGSEAGRARLLREAQALSTT